MNQYHEEKDGTKTILQLGIFDEQAHREWLQRHPHKRPLPPDLRKQVSHFYSNGDICDKTGEPRSTEVSTQFFFSFIIEGLVDECRGNIQIWRRNSVYVFLKRVTTRCRFKGKELFLITAKQLCHILRFFSFKWGKNTNF